MHRVPKVARKSVPSGNYTEEGGDNLQLLPSVCEKLP